MNESRQPATHISLLVMVLSLTLAVPVLAAPAASKDGVAASKHKTVRAKSQQPQLAKKAPAAAAATAGHRVAATPAAKVAQTPQRRPEAGHGGWNSEGYGRPVMHSTLSQPAVQTAVIAPTQALPVAAVVAMPAAASVATAATAVTPAAPAVNPYLAGWYRPIPAAALPAVAVGQINYSARYVSDSVTSIPRKLVDALPSIKTVYPTGGRDLVVANLKCPVEMVTGQYMLPANAMREGVNGLFSRLNESQMLKFDIQLVCS